MLFLFLFLFFYACDRKLIKIKIKTRTFFLIQYVYQNIKESNRIKKFYITFISERKI